MTMPATTTCVASNPKPIPNPNPNPPSNSNTPRLLPINRRGLLAALSLTLSPFLGPPQINNRYADFVSLPGSQARGLFQMPPVRLTNRYFLVRAGESEYESLGIVNTNPVAKTSVDNGLSEKGKKQTVRAAFDLKSMGACENSCWIWPSITQRAYQAAEIIAAVNGVNRSHIVPEYSFLDARGLGAYEGKKLDSISEVYASDSLSPNIKPPPIDDGTPNESVQDVFVRVTQLMSILETQYSADTVIIVSPDSDNLTVLQAGLVGLELRRHRELAFRPGEVRFVDASSVPTYKQPASAVYKCLTPPTATEYSNVVYQKISGFNAIYSLGPKTLVILSFLGCPTIVDTPQKTNNYSNFFILIYNFILLYLTYFLNLLTITLLFTFKIYFYSLLFYKKIKK